jgi:hypothetical protein
MSNLTSPWIKILDQLPLSRTEQEVVNRFAKDPAGRGFLPVADVLRSHRLVEESLELLTQGVQAHPGFSVARVVLARELFQRGMLMDCWRLLEDSPVDLYDNALAQKLKFKMALAFGDENGALDALKYIKLQQGIDVEIRRLSQSLETTGIRATRDAWRRELAIKGVSVEWPRSEEAFPSTGLKPSADPKINQRGHKFILEYQLDDLTRREVSQFHVVPLNEVFAGTSEHELGGHSQSSSESVIELDSTTLADIYAKQGHYTKALGIYRRLLRLAPHNDLLRLKVSELARLEKEQKSEDLELDPVMFDRMEVVEIIDRQIRYFTGLLHKLN